VSAECVWLPPGWWKELASLWYKLNTKDPSTLLYEVPYVTELKFPMGQF